MKIPSPLIAGTLLRRYQRFLADVSLADGTVVTAHTPNTGSMLQCAVPGFRVLLSRSDNPRRRLPYTLERIEVNGFWVDVHTHRANRVVAEGLQNGTINELKGFHVQSEYPYGTSRFDFLLKRENQNLLLEVKNVTLITAPSCASFPDAVTLRGHKHLLELQKALRDGYRAVILFLVQRGEARCFRPADGIDPMFGRLLREAAAAGVEILAYQTLVTMEETVIDAPLPIFLDNLALTPE